MNRIPHGSRSAGFTLVEAAVAAVILIVLAGSLSQSSVALRGIASGGSVQDQLQSSAIKAANRITADLKTSGFVTVGGTSYPFLFTNGIATGGFSAHSHTPADKTAGYNEYDFGQDSEIVFVRPDDADGDGTPDLDGAGQVVWDSTEFSYVLVTSAEGINELQRRTDAANPEVIARHVEHIVFDEWTVADTSVPPQSIRVRIFFRRPDAQGKLYKYSAELVVKLQNG